mmetsp:Transcript_26103/g.40004  ORF Transcript_26103/g.40004 Transcript_26103/m.40004 type:complete len:80 (-) Transcript_26103:988-1227(-)
MYQHSFIFVPIVGKSTRFEAVAIETAQYSIDNSWFNQAMVSSQKWMRHCRLASEASIPSSLMEIRKDLVGRWLYPCSVV